MTEYSRQIYGPKGFAYPDGGDDDDDDDGDCRYRILFTLDLRARPQKFQKILAFLHWATKTSRLTWYNLFGHRST